MQHKKETRAGLLFVAQIPGQVSPFLDAPSIEEGFLANPLRRAHLPSHDLPIAKHLVEDLPLEPGELQWIAAARARQ